MEKDNRTLATITNEKSLTIYKPDTLNRSLVGVYNVHDALTVVEQNPDQYPSLAVIKKDYGTKKAEALIKLFITEISELVNLKRPLTERQTDSIAMEVVSRFYALTVADVYVIFRKAKNGEFGELYESLDMPKVMKWFSDYFSERCEAGANLTMRESDQLYDKGGNMTSERMTKHFNALEKQFKDKKENDYRNRL